MAGTHVNSRWPLAEIGRQGLRKSTAGPGLQEEAGADALKWVKNDSSILPWQDLKTMRGDVAVAEVLAKCDVLKQAGMWPGEPHLRPRAWISNFDDADQLIAATLLDRFTFYNGRLTDRLLMASYDAIADGMYSGPLAPPKNKLIAALSNSVFAPVEGEDPNPTDSGNLLCRKARQILNVPQRTIVSTNDALNFAKHGGTVVFVDDFVGSGDQFLTTWRRSVAGDSFESVQRSNDFVAIYVTLVTTEFGLSRINNTAPGVAMCAAHVLENRSTLHGFVLGNPGLAHRIESFLDKYCPRLRPTESYIASNQAFRKWGYNEHGLMFGFEHSIPDATLPIFWAKGDNSWEPLIERI